MASAATRTACSVSWHWISSSPLARLVWFPSTKGPFPRGLSLLLPQQTEQLTPSHWQERHSQATPAILTLIPLLRAYCPDLTGHKRVFAVDNSCMEPLSICFCCLCQGIYNLKIRHCRKFNRRVLEARCLPYGSHR